MKISKKGKSFHQKIQKKNCQRCHCNFQNFKRIANVTENVRDFKRMAKGVTENFIISKKWKKMSP